MRGSLSEELPPASNRVSKDPRVSLGPLSPSGHPDQSRRWLATSVMRRVCGMGRIEAAAPGSRAGRHPGPGSELPRLCTPGAVRRCCVGVEGVAPGWGPSSHLGLTARRREPTRACCRAEARRGSVPSLELGQAAARCVGSSARPPSLSGSRRRPVCLPCTRLVPVVRVVCSRRATP